VYFGTSKGQQRRARGNSGRPTGSLRFPALSSAIVHRDTPEPLKLTRSINTETRPPSPNLHASSIRLHDHQIAHMIPFFKTTLAQKQCSTIAEHRSSKITQSVQQLLSITR